MRHRMFFGLTVAALAACSSGTTSREISRPVEVRQEGERSPAKSAGWCTKCNYSVYESHRCGVTHPCALCGREIGRRHMHEVVWQCERHELVMSEQHICYDAKNCRICRKDRRSLLGTKPCERCYRQVPPTTVRGITTYCQECDQEIGANHLCGRTAYCRTCLREAGSNHVHDATRLCMEHGTEHSPIHMHGTTAYCQKCHRDAGEGHRHGLTEWCWLCEAEMEWPHSHHN